jgi:hypothetical protein
VFFSCFFYFFLWLFRVYGKSGLFWWQLQQIHRRGASTTSLGLPQGHQVITSPNTGWPQSTVMVTTELSGNHPKRRWGIAQVLARQTQKRLVIFKDPKPPVNISGDRTF